MHQPLSGFHVIISTLDCANLLHFFSPCPEPLGLSCGVLGSHLEVGRTPKWSKFH